ncbi:PilN domain-containing protein [Congregibacter variabilis]|uniref:PilN domain-containing protein n=1 Tax=Congregibacter variabilis TaxID=3081200 RepID=A0ABZ0I3S0_9GAMM|nr:PilN domain-containing protein [Congregibacter sp. IMCC43200]
MAVQSNQWMLFGIDMRHIVQQWLSAWRELLLSPRSPIRQQLDEPVLLYRDGRTELFQGGKPLSAAPQNLTPCTAHLLPDDLVLARSLSLPIAAEPELPAVLAMEVAAASPFKAEDSVYGWCETDRDAQSIQVSMAIASRSSIERWKRETEVAAKDQNDGEPEIWAEANGALVALSGFGEAQREVAYRRRLLRSGLLLGGVLVLVLVSAAVFAVQQRSALERFERLQSKVQAESQSVSAMRATLVDANETVRAANAFVADYPNPHIEIARLTELLEDEAYIMHFSMRGRELRVRGRAKDAAVVMQTLAQTPAFVSVTAPQAITAVGNTGLEQFHLDIEVGSVKLAGDES